MSIGTAVAQNQLARRLGAFDATMLVMGGIVGSGIFLTPHVVAQRVHSSALILGAWLAGGFLALIGAFVYRELAQRLPHSGGQYAYLREAFHPAVAFVYGWALLLVIQTGGMAAVATAFARYFIELTHARLPESAVAVTAVIVLTIVNCLGVRAGSTVQSGFMVLKGAAIVVLILVGFTIARGAAVDLAPATTQPAEVSSFAAAIIPVMFSYGGWQTASFVSAELRNPARDLGRGLLYGVLGVVLLYLGVNAACLLVLGPVGLANAPAPASSVMRLAFGEAGATFIAAGIAISTLGFLSQGMLTAPRVYFAMAQDGLFFKPVARVSSRTRAPVVAILVQGLLTVVIALSGTFEQILNYVVSVDFVFFGLTAASIFVFRRRDAAGANRAAPVQTAIDARDSEEPTSRSWRVPLHPVSTMLFVTASVLIVLNTLWRFPGDSLIGFGIMLSGLPVYMLWRQRSTRQH